jgi:glycerophosphoryl diester phosphodiesterase
MASQPLLLGHRGLRAQSLSVRENTIAAFDVALEHGCDGFEFDVRLTADNHPVICHGARFAGVSIARASCSRVRTLPLLEAVLARYAQRAFLDIELKVPGIEAHVVDSISKLQPRGYVVSSFLPDVLLELRSRSQSLPLGTICETRKQLSIWRELPVQYVIAHHSLITAELVQNIHAQGKTVFAWTVNNRSSMLRLAKEGVDGIVSDKTELLVATLRPG